MSYYAVDPDEALDAARDEARWQAERDEEIRVALGLDEEIPDHPSDDDVPPLPDEDRVEDLEYEVR